MVEILNMKEKGYEGDYVCHHCHLIYGEHGDRLRCDLCNRKLRWASAERIKELEVMWSRQEHRRGLSPDFAYHRQGT